MSFVVIKQDGLHARAFGPYRSFKRADKNATEWGAFVLPLENADTCEPPPWVANAMAQPLVTK